ncbi:hypothetical protein L3V83_03020 [Thiotrichales bacterium 19X7-9]|nr:hypothetical protein [Thiotrichales bacterium 19X7-9]
MKPIERFVAVSQIAYDMLIKAFSGQTVQDYATQNELFLPEGEPVYRIHTGTPKNGLEARSFEFPMTLQQIGEYVAYNKANGQKPLVYGGCKSIEDLEAGYLGAPLLTTEKSGLLIGIPKHKISLPSMAVELIMSTDESSPIIDKIKREQEIIFGEMKENEALIYITDFDALKSGKPVKNLLHEFNNNRPEYVTLEEINNPQFLQNIYKKLNQTVEQKMNEIHNKELDQKTDPGQLFHQISQSNHSNQETQPEAKS